MLFIVPDTHFRHAKLIVCGARPPDFESRLMAAWRETVAPADDVIVLGDIGFGDCGDIFRALPGRKILIRGNHDHGSDAKFRAMSFSLVCDSLTVRMRGRRVLLTHCPMYEHGYDINVHGHLHSLFTYPGPGLRLPLALEASDFAPIAAGEHFEKMVESFCRRFEEQDIRPAAADFAALHRPGRKKPRRMSPEGFLRFAEDEATFEARRACQRREEKLMALLGRRPRRVLDEARTFLHGAAANSATDEEAWDRLTQRLGLGNAERTDSA